MKTFDRWAWGIAAVVAGISFVAVEAFGWNPSPRIVAGTAFIAVFWVARVTYLLVKINAE